MEDEVQSSNHVGFLCLPCEYTGCPSPVPRSDEHFLGLFPRSVKDELALKGSAATRIKELRFSSDVSYNKLAV
jgi:hypothetical protein